MWCFFSTTHFQKRFSTWLFWFSYWFSAIEAQTPTIQWNKPTLLHRKSHIWSLHTRALSHSASSAHKRRLESQFFPVFSWSATCIFPLYEQQSLALDKNVSFDLRIHKQTKTQAQWELPESPFLPSTCISCRSVMGEVALSANEQQKKLLPFSRDTIWEKDCKCVCLPEICVWVESSHPDYCGI